MDFILTTGLIGSLILVVGAAWPEKKQLRHPIYSVRNWLFTVGTVVMFAYALLGYFQTGEIFFVLLEILMLIASIMMMLNIRTKISIPIILLCTLGFMFAVLFIFETNFRLLLFVVGLGITGVGYIINQSDFWRNVILTFGSTILGLFSYLDQNWVFLGLNLFFAAFSFYYVVKEARLRYCR